MKTFVTTGCVEGGVLRIRNRAKLEAEFKTWKDGEVTVTIERAHATRSLDQNALYWAGYVQPIADYTGNSVDWTHAYLKNRFLPKQRIEIVDRKTGVVVDEQDLAQLTTTTLNRVEFSEYLKAIEEWVLDEFHGAVEVGSSRAA